MQTSPTPFRCARFATAILVIISLMLSPVVWACGGTPVPPTCARAIFLAKFCPGVVVVPATGPITIPIGVLPFLIWDKKTKGCAKPISAEIELTLICGPVGGPPLPDIGPFTFPMPTPKKPGPQPLSGPLQFVIPAGAIPAVPPNLICTVVGTYKVTFGPGIGAGLLAATGDTQVCLVEPASDRADVPRLDMRYLPLDKKGQDHFQTCRRGDQAFLYYLITNNDPEYDVTVDLTASTKQVSRLPDGFTSATPGPNFAAGVFAISNPDPDTDAFPIAFGNMLAPGELIPEPDPHLPVAPITQLGLNIPPLESAVISVATRSHGMCADGSCSENNLVVEGLFGNGDDALACASTALLVGDPRGKSALCEFTDDIKVGSKADTRWSPCRFGDGGGDFPHSNTFFPGNLGPGEMTPQPDLINLLTGAPLAKKFSQPYSNKASDLVRIDQPTTQCNYNAFFQFDPDFIGVFNHVEIDGLDAVPSGSKGKVTIPAVIPDPPLLVDSFFDVFVNLALDQVQVVRTNPSPGTIFNGTFKEFGKGKFAGAKLDKSTSRTINKFGGLDQPVISADSLGVSRSFTGTGGASFVQPLLSGGNTSLFFKWKAQLAGKGVKALNTSGTAQTPVVLLDQTRNKVPNSTGEVSVLNIHVSGAVNTPFQIPVITRVVPNFCLHDDFDPNSFIKFNSEIGDYIFNSSMGTQLLGRGKVKFKNDILSLKAKEKDGSLADVTVDFFTELGEANVIPVGTGGLFIMDSTAFDTCP